MSDSLAGFVLAAGAGTRLRPLTSFRPKALCPVGNVALVDLALDRVTAVCGDDVVVNVHHGRDAIEAHFGDGGPTLSVEEPAVLGTAGGIARARGLLEGRGVLVVNADAWCEADLSVLVDGWDGERLRLLLVGGGPLTATSQVAGCLLPWSEVAGLPVEPAGLYEASWAPAAAEGRIEIVGYDGPFVDCGTPADYLRANLLSSNGRAVVHPAAVVDGTVERSVVWDTGWVRAGEELVDAIRIGPRLTVLVR